MPTVPHTCTVCGGTFMQWAYRNYKRCPDCCKKKPFTKQQLEQLYLHDHKSMYAIARECQVSRRVVGYWIHKYQIPTRTPMETYRPELTSPSRETLYNLYWIQWKSGHKIAKLYNVDPTAVYYWLNKYDIPKRSVWGTRRNGKDIREPTEDELKELYVNQHLSTKDIGALYGLSAQTITRRLLDYSIELRLPGYSQERFECEDGHTVRSGLEMRVDNWLYQHGLAHSYEPELPFRGRSDFLVKGVYIEVWGITHSKKYQSRTRAKKRLYKQHGLKLIGLYPHDIFAKLDDKLKVLL